MGHEVVLYKGKHVVLEERALYLALGFVSRYGADLLQSRINSPRLRGLLAHWETAVRSSTPGIDVQLEERLATPEDASDLAELLAYAEKRVAALGELAPAELCNEVMELQGTNAAFQAGFRTERIVATLERLRQLL